MSDPYRGPYRFTFPSSATITYEYPAGRTRTITRSAGGAVVFDDACEARAFITGFLSARFGYEPRDSRLGTQNIIAACENAPLEEILDRPGSHLGTPPSGPEGRGILEGQIREETPETLGARPGPPVMRIELGTQAPPPTSRGQRAIRYFSPGQDHADETDIYDWVESDGLGREDASAEALHIFRNLPDDDRPHLVFGVEASRFHFAENDPVIVATGQFAINVIDVHIPARGFPIQLERTYRSGPAWFGPWGYNWDHNYNMFLRELRNGGVALWTGAFVEEQYFLRGDGSFDPTPSVFRKLEKVSDSFYVLSESGGMRLHFGRPSGWPEAHRIPLIAIEDRAGNRHTLHYNSLGRLERVVDDAGRYIEMEYGACGLLERIRDHTDRAWRYFHDSDIEHLVAVVTPDMDHGFSARYVYDRTDEHPALHHNIVEVYDGSGSIVVENHYGHDRASDDFNRVVSQRMGSTETFFRKTALQYVPPGPAHVAIPAYRVEVHSHGRYIAHTFNYRGDLVETNMRLCADRSFRLARESFAYDSQGNLTEHCRPNGLRRLMRYDSEALDPRARSNLLELSEAAPLHHPIGTRIIGSWTYEPRFHRLKTFRDAEGNVTEYRYDYEELLGNRGLLVQMRLPDIVHANRSHESSVEAVRLSSAGEIVEHISPEGRRTIVDYYESGPHAGLVRQISSPDIDVLPETFTYDRYGNLAAISRGEHIVVEYEHDKVGRLVAVRPSATIQGRGETRISYDAAGRVRFIDMPRGDFSDATISDPHIRHEVRYDAFGVPSKLTIGVNTASPATWDFVNDVNGNPIRVTDPEGRVTRFFYNECEKLLRHIEHWRNPQETTTRYVYDLNGNCVRVIDGEGHALDFEYDGWDRLRRVVEPGMPDARSQLELQYSDRDEPEELRFVSPTGTVIRQYVSRHDELGRITSRGDGSRMERYSYDRDGLLVGIEDSYGATANFTYDSAGRPIRGEYPLGGRMECAYDNLHRLTSLQANGKRMSFAYDTRDRPIAVTDPLGNTERHEYDDRGLLAAVVSPAGRRLEIEYDAFGLVTALIGSGNQRRSFRRDALGRIIWATDPLHRETQYRYGVGEDWVAIRRPDGSGPERSFDRAGRLMAEGSSSASFRYTYNPAGFVDRIDADSFGRALPVGPIQFTRDAIGRVLTVSDRESRVEFTYDAVGRIASESQPAGLVQVTRNDEVRTKLLTYPDGRVDQFEHDLLGRLARISVVTPSPQDDTLPAGLELARYEYGASGLSRRITASGTSTFDYDAAGRLVEIHHQRGTGETICGVRYLYDADGQRAVMWSRGHHNFAETYLYNDAGQLSRVRRYRSLPPSPEIQSQGDSDTFIRSLEALAPEFETTYHWNLADELERVIVIGAGGTVEERWWYNELGQPLRLERGGESFAFSFDAECRRTEDDRHRYVYDAFGRLREVFAKGTGALLLALEYDAAGRLARKRTALSSISFAYENARVIARTEGERSVNLLWGSGPELIHESGLPGQWFYLDAIASCICTTTRNGALHEAYERDEFGMPRTEENTALFATYHPLGPPGLFDARARVYDAATRSFLQRDPFEGAGWGNSYTYALGDPVNVIDPTGEIPPIIAIAVIAGALFGIGYVAEDASSYPDRYGIFGNRVDRAEGMGLIVGAVTVSALTAGAAALLSEGILASVGMSSLVSGTTGLAGSSVAPVVYGQTLHAGWGVGFHALASAASLSFYRRQQNMLFPNQVAFPTVRSVVNDASLGGGLRLLGMAGSHVWRAAAGRWSGAIDVSFEVVRAAGANPSTWRPTIRGLAYDRRMIFLNLDRVRPGTLQYARTRAHEFLHRLLPRATNWLYARSHLWRAGEEFAAQTLATGSARIGLGQLNRSYRLDPYRIVAEGLGVASLVGGVAYNGTLRSQAETVHRILTTERAEQRGVVHHPSLNITGSAK